MGYDLRNKENKNGDLNGENYEDEIKRIVNEAVKTAMEKLMNVVKNLEIQVETLVRTNDQLSSKLQEKTCENCGNSIASNEILFKSDDLDPSVSSNSSCDTVVEIEKLTLEEKMNDKNSEYFTEDLRKKNDVYKGVKRNMNNRNSVIIGSNKVNKEDSGCVFESGTRLWLYVGKCKKETTEEQVLKYLQKMEPGRVFDVTKLVTRGTNTAFRVGADVDLQDKLYNGVFWPSGIVIKRFIFRKSGQGTGKF